MPAGIAIEDVGHTVGDFGEMARKKEDAKQARRFGAIALVMGGRPGRAKIASPPRRPDPYRADEGPMGGAL